MSDVIIIGGGPAGLSAALFCAKNGLETRIFDTDKTWMHSAHLFNYLGIRSVSGSEFQTLAKGQVADMGAEFHANDAVEAVEPDDDAFVVATASSDFTANYVVLATGANRDLAEDVGCDFDDNGVVSVNLSMETSIDDLYATGAMVREQEWQAIISAGDGAAAALNILSKEEGEHFHDFDTPDDVREW